MATRTRVLLTGAAGRIGNFLAGHLAEQYDFVLTDVRLPDNMHGFPFMAANLTDLEAVRALCRDVDIVVHMAADPRTTATWESLLPNNIIGAQHVFQAAHEAGCRRVIFASTVNVVAGYPRETQIHTSMPVRPLNLYGASKAWGEALASFYADQRGLSAICLRFGWVMDRNNPNLRAHTNMLDIGLTFEDLARLVVASIEAPADLRFGIFHGVSNNHWKRLDISDARAVLGYDPQDDLFALAGIKI